LTGWKEKHGDRSILDPLDHLCVAGACDTETEVKRALKNQNIAVLGAGLSGSAAALLLRSRGASDKCSIAPREELLKSTIDNLGRQDAA